MPKIDRKFILTAFGNVHVAQTHLFDYSATPVLCLHMSGHSGKSFECILKAANGIRRYIAIDYPGYGTSDSVPYGIEMQISDYAKVAWEVIDSLFLKRIHIVGHHTGAKVAAEMARQRPESVHHLILMATSTAVPDQIENAESKPLENIRPAAAWDMIESFMPTDTPNSILQDMFTEFIKAGPQVFSAQAAAQRYSAEYINVLKSLTNTITVVNLGDDLRDHTPKVMCYVKNGKLVEKLEWQHGFLQFHADDVFTFVENSLAEKAITQSVPTKFLKTRSPKLDDIFWLIDESHVIRKNNCFTLDDRKIYYMNSGEAYIFAPLSTKKKMISQLVFPGLFFQGIRGKSLTALDDCEVLSFGMDEFESMQSSQPSIGLKILKDMQNTIMELHENMNMSKADRSRQAISAYIIAIAKHKKIEKKETFDIKMTREEIGQFLGLTMETVSRGLTELRHAGVIELKQKRVRIIDSTKLEKFANLS